MKKKELIKSMQEAVERDERKELAQKNYMSGIAMYEYLFCEKHGFDTQNGWWVADDMVEQYGIEVWTLYP